MTRSTVAKKVRIKISRGGLEIVVPEGRQADEGLKFLQENQRWAAAQLERSKRLQAIHRLVKRPAGEILYRGESTPIKVLRADAWQGSSRIKLENGEITIRCGNRDQLSLTRSLENWLRKQAREQIKGFLRPVATRLHREPNSVYVMGQRTKWGNCSALGNLSFNWRLIMAPDFVLRYLVVHEAVHLAIPDHSRKYWLTVQSLCRETEQARRWLVANQLRLTEPLLISQ